MHEKLIGIICQLLYCQNYFPTIFRWYVLSMWNNFGKSPVSHYREAANRLDRTGTEPSRSWSMGRRSIVATVWDNGRRLLRKFLTFASCSKVSDNNNDNGILRWTMFVQFVGRCVVSCCKNVNTRLISEADLRNNFVTKNWNWFWVCSFHSCVILKSAPKPDHIQFPPRTSKCGQI